MAAFTLIRHQRVHSLAAASQLRVLRWRTVEIFWGVGRLTTWWHQWLTVVKIARRGRRIGALKALLARIVCWSCVLNALEHSFHVRAALYLQNSRVYSGA
jgi:hypothetical protein